MAEGRVAEDVGAVTIGVDTHRDEHVAVAVDGLGRRLGERRFAATAAGTAALVRWVGAFGGSPVAAVEGSGCYGKALTRALRAASVPVWEVARADRQERRRVGKDDPTDAEQAARSVLAGRVRAVAKAGDGPVEQLRMLRLCRRSAVKARSEAICQLKALVVSAPAELRDALAGHSTLRLLRAARAFRPGSAPASTDAVCRLALKELAERCAQLEAQIARLDAQLQRLTAEAAPTLLAVKGVGVDSAATLLVAAGDNPDRLRSEAAFARLCGVPPIPASSGQTRRHRLHRGGNRDANRALYMIVVGRLAWCEKTRAYRDRRLQEGLSRRDVIRCLKRYVVRELYPHIRHDLQTTT